MDARIFEIWLGAIPGLTETQRGQAFQALALSEAAETDDVEADDPWRRGLAGADRTAAALSSAVPDGTSAVAALGQHRVNTIGCPHCAHPEVVRWGTASALPRYRCKACARTFNALTKTPLAKLRMKEKWAAQTEAMIDRVSLAKAARRCGVHPTTAFRWRHRFLASLAGDKPGYRAFSNSGGGVKRPRRFFV